MELVIVQQNVCGRDVYEGKRTIQNYEKLIKEVREKNPDIIFLTEFYYQQMYSITQKILKEYEFIKPVLLSEEYENRDGLYASCILAIKKIKVNIGKKFKLSNMLDFRYVCVDLNIKTGEVLEVLKVLLMYVPQTYNAPKYRVEQKRKMLISANEYVTKNSNTLIFVGGDMNSDIDGRTTTCIKEFEQIYEKMIDTDHKKETTWQGKRLDYALVSKTMKNSVKKTIPVETQSDHKGLQTVLNI